MTFESLRRWVRQAQVDAGQADGVPCKTEVLAGYEPDQHGRRSPEASYGSVKMWAHLHRAGVQVGDCAVERLMKANGWHGVSKTKKISTAIADFTYVRLTTATFVCTALVIEAFAGRIVGWESSTNKHPASTSNHTASVERAIAQAAASRARQGNPLQGKTIHHSDAGSQYTSLHLAETLQLHGLNASIERVGDAYNNALAETTIGLNTTECIRDDSPFRRGPLTSLGSVETITGDWVHWSNTSRLMT